MTLEIISPSEILFKGEAQSVTLPGVLGLVYRVEEPRLIDFCVKKGEVFYRTPEGTENSVDIKGGLADVDNNVVSVCVY